MGLVNALLATSAQCPTPKPRLLGVKLFHVQRADMTENQEPAFVARVMSGQSLTMVPPLSVAARLNVLVPLPEHLATVLVLPDTWAMWIIGTVRPWGVELVPRAHGPSQKIPWCAVAFRAMW